MKPDNSVSDRTREDLKRKRDAGAATVDEMLVHHERRREAIRGGEGDPCAPPSEDRGMPSPMESLLGKTGELPRCKVFTKDVAMHWLPAGAKVGDRCLCGETTMKKRQ